MSVVARKSKDQPLVVSKRRDASTKALLKSQRPPRINARNKLDSTSFSGFG